MKTEAVVGGSWHKIGTFEFYWSISSHPSVDLKISLLLSQFKALEWLRALQLSNDFMNDIFLFMQK